MDKRNLLHFSARVAFVVACFAIALAIAEWGLQILGYSLIGHAYAAGRLLELSATPLLYVITVLLWEILSELKSG